MNLPDIRTGNGFDVHRLVEGRRCIICGVDIPHTLGLLSTLYPTPCLAPQPSAT